MIGNKVTYIEVDYYDIDKLITDFYGREYESVDYQEWNNDESHSINIEKGPLDKWEQETVNNWKTNGKGMWSIRTLLKDICNNEGIEPGEYLISVSW